MTNTVARAAEIGGRIENIMAEKREAMAEFRESIADLYLEAKKAGLDVKALRQAVAERERERKRELLDSALRDEIDAYRAAMWQAGGDVL
jgi:uncharacterized protein (UPF0335 family)